MNVLASSFSWFSVVCFILAFFLFSKIGVCAPPVLSAEFVPDTITIDQTTQLVVTIDNSLESTDATDILVRVFVTSGNRVRNATVPSNETTDCIGGTLQFNGSALRLENATVPAGAICTVSMDVEPFPGVSGNFLIPVGELTSSAGSSGSTSAELSILSPTYQPDVRIGFRKGKLIGNGIYNRSGARQSISFGRDPVRRAKFFFAVENDGNANGSFRVTRGKGGKYTDRETKARIFKISGGRTNISGRFDRVAYQESIPAGGRVVYQVQIKGRPTLRKIRRRNLSVFAAHYGGVPAVDISRIRVVFD